ncbi:alpha/beta-hydrolase [Guyanagaster necrorhizus]|uniref:Alpha/beta-hydrolase n=1 Tax=Guyanagaster necrorhizus TaxID=856835 RepID=A0A9P7VMF8_9AGAR|nr:alpha/beta-hydrolase [Guyanagaster necrorhizus MCA 3950]KAG7442589.1 alpha/beta-hydrolase [Guyanagaster necrorhizus MCA 3950]
MVLPHNFRCDMSVNPLTVRTILRAPPLLLKTLLNHYFKHVIKKKPGKSSTRLRRDELLYDEMFSLLKMFLTLAANHTIEEFQAFSNNRTSSPRRFHVERLLVPMSSCEDAAKYLVKALGGQDVARRVVGGVKWWQVRAINGVDAEWITTKKDLREANRRDKAKAQSTLAAAPATKAMEELKVHTREPDLGPETDEMRCFLYLHGGGYYVGSLDQERSSIHQHAQLINGRVFAINYRLAPQYPFPCAIQDALAAYLYLIKPPLEAKHRAIKPSHILLSGDSAGGGLSLALLQVIRDSGLPLPAGAVLVSPWCDLNHSFPSITTNTDTDIIPKYGLSISKPSPLWPPPSQAPCTAAGTLTTQDQELQTIHSRPTESGEVLTIEWQMHPYSQNSLLRHPLISPVLSYLGGLPPLLIIASGKEVLCDEIVYTAHKAADPEKYPVREEIRKLYPALDGIEMRCGKTKVHLQVYDGADAAHTLPTQFGGTPPAKAAYDAIRLFARRVTGMEATAHSVSSSSLLSLSIMANLSLHQDNNGFIRERVSVKGAVRPLEATSDLEAMKIPPEFVGVMSESAAEQIIEGHKVFKKKFSHTEKAIERRRKENLRRAENYEEKGSAQWSLDEGEVPPPGCNVVRRDNVEARRLAKQMAQRFITG